MTVAWLETEARRPSYNESREPSEVKNFIGDCGIFIFGSKWDIGRVSMLNLSSSEQNDYTNSSNMDQIKTDTPLTATGCGFG